MTLPLDRNLNLKQMKFTLKKSKLFFTRFFILILIIFPNLGKSQNCNCTSTGNFPSTVSGVNITQNTTGSIQNYGSNYTNCGLSAGPLWVGSGGAFNQTFNFSQPVNNVGYIITATNDTEFFTFSVNNGVLNATQGCGCGFTQNGNTFNGTPGMNGSGTIIFLNSSQPYTSITINGTGTGNGSLIGLCVQSFSSCVTPTIVTSPSTTMCLGSPKTLTVTGGSNYIWTPSTGLSATTGSNVSANPTVTTTYSVTAGTGTCTTMAQITVTVLPTPTVNISSNAPVCSTKTLNLNTTSVGTYSWTGPNGFTSLIQNPVINNVTTAASGIYTLSITSPTTCPAVGTLNVLINPTPTVAAVGATVCPNQNINLSSNLLATASYSWAGPNNYVSALQNPVIANAQPSLAGVYNLTIASVAGCTNTGIANVVVNPVPNPVVNNNSPVCVGGTLSLTASGATNYSWTGPNGFSSLLQNPNINNVSLSANGVYSLIASNGSCTNSATTGVTINPSPTITVGNSGPVCTTKTLNLTANGGIGYSWFGPSGFSNLSQNPSINNVLITNGGNYSVVVTGANSCTASAVTNVIVNPTPLVNPTGATVCPGQSINLTSNLVAASTYSWSGANNFASTSQSPVINNAQANLAGVYNLTITSAVGCSNSNTANVVVNLAPTPLINTNSPLCVGNNLNLAGNGGIGYNWIGPNGFVSILQNSTLTAVSAVSSGVYSLVVSSANNCTAVATTTVIVNTNPVIVIGNTGPVCETKSVSVTASGGSIYNWTGPLGFTSSQQNPVIGFSNFNQAGVYNVVVTNTNNCTSTAQTTLVVNANPVAIASGGTVCIGATATLAANGGGSYLWYGPNGYTSIQQNPFVPNMTANNAGAYTVVVTAPNSCTSANQANLGVYTPPTITMSSSGPVCLNKEVKLFSSGGFIYSWSGPNNFVSNEQNTSFIADDITTSGNYVVTVTDNKGCSNSQTLNVTVYPLPIASLAGSATKNCVPFCATYSVVGANTQLQNVSWLTTFGGSVSGNVLTKCFTEAGDYNLKASITDVNGCSNTATFVATAYPLPVANFAWNPNPPIEKIEPATFTDLTTIGGPATEWNWWFINNNNYSNKQSPSYLFQDPGVFPVALVVRNKWGCTDSIVKLVTVNEDYGLYIPNAFSPDGDDINDVFQPKGFGIKNYTMTIYDRWGEILFTSKDFLVGWDGTRKGVICKNDVYVFKITLTNSFGKNIEKIGHVTLMK